MEGPGSGLLQELQENFVDKSSKIDSTEWRHQQNVKSENDVTENVDPENSEATGNFVVPYNGQKPNTGQIEGKTIQIIWCQGCCKGISIFYKTLFVNLCD